MTAVEIVIFIVLGGMLFPMLAFVAMIAWRTSTAVAQVVGVLEGHKAMFEAIGDRFAALYDRLDAYNTNNETLFITLRTEFNTRMDKLDERVGLLEKDMAEVKADVSVLKTNMGLLREEVTLIKANMEAQQQDITLIKTNMEAQQQDITLIKTNMEAQQQDITLIKANMEAQQQDITLIKANMEAQQRDMTLIKEHLLGEAD